MNNTNANSMRHLSSIAVQRSLLVMVALLFLAVYGPTLVWLWKRWMMGVWYQSHGILIPFVSAWLVWRRLKSWQGKGADQGSALGFFFLVPALFMHVVDTRLWTQILSALSIVPAAIGLSFLFLGRSRTLAIWFPLVLLFLMIPIPSVAFQPIILVLRKLTAVGTEAVLRLAGIPLVRTGTVLEFTNGALNIDDPCSGLTTLMATLAFTVIAIYVWPTGTRRSLLFLMLAPLVALCANIIRVLILTFMFINFGEESLDTFWHPLSGYLAYVFGIGFQIGMLGLLRRGVR